MRAQSIDERREAQRATGPQLWLPLLRVRCECREDLVASGRRRVTPARLDTDVEDSLGRGRQLLTDIAGEGRDKEGHAQPPDAPAEEQVVVAAQYQAQGHERRLLRRLLRHLRASERAERELRETWRVVPFHLRTESLASCAGHLRRAAAPPL